jgi:hypothetical protein
MAGLRADGEFSGGLSGNDAIHDLAAEFGISSEQLMYAQGDDIFVRSHLTPLKDEQVF